MSNEILPDGFVFEIEDDASDISPGGFVITGDVAAGQSGTIGEVVSAPIEAITADTSSTATVGEVVSAPIENITASLGSTATIGEVVPAPIESIQASIDNGFLLNGGLGSADQSKNTPSNVHSIVNVNDSDGGTVNLSHGGRRYTGTSVSRCTSVMASGKFYWEVRWVSVASARVGIKSSAGAFGSPNSNLGQLTDEWAMRNDGHVRHNNATPVATGITWNNNDILNVALDVDAGNLWFGENGVWYNAGDPAAGTNPTQTGITGSMTAALDANTGIVEFLFEAVDWAHTAPTGFVAVNSANIIPGQAPPFAVVS